MIISASYRTDIPAFYPKWFSKCMAAGYFDVLNPYSGKTYRVSQTTQHIQGYIFWTRNILPFLENLETISKQRVPFVVQFTLTGYPRVIEKMVPKTEQAIEQIRRISNIYGIRSVVWRYDPIVFTSKTPPAFHLETFRKIAAKLTGRVDEVCLSWVNLYRKTERNLSQAAILHNFKWWEPNKDEKQTLLIELADIAGNYGIKPTICSQPDLTSDRLKPATCIDLIRLSDIAGNTLTGKQKGNRPGCFCAESRDIGAYETCPHGCVYCYAVNNQKNAISNFRNHDPTKKNLFQKPQT